MVTKMLSRIEVEERLKPVQNPLIRVWVRNYWNRMRDYRENRDKKIHKLHAEGWEIYDLMHRFRLSYRRVQAILQKERERDCRDRTTARKYLS